MTLPRTIQMAVARLAALLAILLSAAVSAADVPPLPKPGWLLLPTEVNYRLEPDGMIAWLGARPLPGTEPSRATGPGCWRWETMARRWHPATGATSEARLDLPGQAIAQLPLPAGTFSISTMDCEDPGRLRLMLQLSDGARLVAETREPLGAMRPLLLPLGPDGAVIVTRDKSTRHITPFVARRREGRLVLERRAPLKIPYRGDFTAEMTADGRLMILGGSDAEYRGCNPCRADTHFLDLASDTWRPGPAMLEARAEAGAVRLPDGSILVSGGWTNLARWGLGPSATAEVWNPRTDRFEALPPMPSGTARHRFATLPWLPGRVFAVEGVNGSEYAFDLASRTWRVAAAWTSGSEEGGCGFFPFRLEGHTYAWRVNRTEGHYSSKSCDEPTHATLSLLRPFGTDAGPPAPPLASSLITFRGDPAFVPAARVGDERRPALVIGGHAHAGMNTELMSSAVEAVDPSGRVWTLPSLRHARSGARAFRVGDGVLVAGGVAAWSHLDPEGAARVLPMEWLADARPAKAQAWSEGTGTAPAASSVLAQMPDSTLLEFASPGPAVTQWRAEVKDGTLTLQGTAWPPLPRARRTDPEHPMRIRALADGRVVVAGGLVQTEKIALYTPAAERADTPDEYIGIGPFLPARRHDIFDPVKRRWQTSAPATAAGGSVFVFPDGRVLKTVTEGPPDASNEGNPARRVTRELSRADGTGWTRPPEGWAGGSRLAANGRLRVFAVDDEVFASGEIPDTEVGYASSAIEWLNPQTERWEPVWTAAARESWRTHLGRLIVHTLPGGRTVLLPAGGF